MAYRQSSSAALCLNEAHWEPSGCSMKHSTLDLYPFHVYTTIMHNPTLLETLKG